MGYYIINYYYNIIIKSITALVMAAVVVVK